MDRLTVQEAAERLGVKEDAARKRIQRGSLVHEKEDGRVYVYLDEAQDEVHPQAQVQDNGELVEELRDRMRYLERQLDQEREARTEERRRHETLLAQLTQRIPELEAPSGLRNGHETATAEPVKTTRLRTALRRPQGGARGGAGGSGSSKKGADQFKGANQKNGQ